MTAAIPATEPQQITAGDTVQWTKDLNDYPAGTWTLTYALVNSAGKIEITATADGTTHAVTLPATTTDDYAAGQYSWQAYVTSGSVRKTVGTGSIKILANLAAVASGGTDTRTHARRTLDNLEAVIEGRATTDQEAYTIMGRSLKRMSVEELMAFRDKYASMVKTEENAQNAQNGIGGKNRIKVRF